MLFRSSFWVANEAIIDIKEDILMDIPFGTVDFQSHFETRVSTVDSMIISSRVGDVRFEAFEGTSTFHGDLVGIAAGSDNGDGIAINSSDKMLLSANREFDLLAGYIDYTALTELKINSKLNNIEFEAGSTLFVSASSNIVASAADEIQLESVLGDVSLESDGVLSLLARNIQTKSTDVYLSSDQDFLVDGTGRANFYSENDNVLTISNAFFLALESIQYVGTSDGDITFDVKDRKSVV